ncbi:MAG: B12-binding domain-containing radical SAM protein [Deltaproteobacteria bacterium]|nr:B12-binding domain-containing radical SAM protein [Deltaproteobacteria bacterium]
MRVLLVNPPDEMEAMFGVGRGLVQTYEPLGLLYVAAVARDAGHDVAVIDAAAGGLDRTALRERIRAAVPEVVGFSTLTCSGAAVWELGRWIRRELPGVFVVLGNVHASVYARQYLEQGAADAVVHGEGELPFRELLDRLAAGRRSLDGIAAVSWLDRGQLRPAGAWSVVPDLSVLPMPARDLVDPHAYRLTELSNQNYVARGDRVAKTLVTSRGCPYRCRFCVVHHGLRPRYDTPRRVVDEMQLLEERYHAGYVYIQDPLFMGERRRVLEIAAEIRRRGLSLQWGCDANVNYLDPGLLRAMDAANCYELSLGIESGVQRSLDAVGKRLTPERVREAVRRVREQTDILLEGLFILGIPGETRDEVLETIRFAVSLGLDMAQFSILTPYPGSPLFEELAAAGELDTGIRPDGSLDTSVWTRYSSYIMFTDNQPIWVTPTLDWQELRRLQKKALRDFYLRPRMVLRQLRRLRPSNLVRSAAIALRGFF